MNAPTSLEQALDLAPLWKPFTANRRFKSAPRLLVAAKGMYYTAHDGREILDGTAGLWCVNAGHARPEIVAAIQRQAATLDYAPAFQLGHPVEFEAAARLVAHAPPGFSHAFFCNSGSEAVESALKIALAYHRARGEGARQRIIGRERGYHGVNFGGMSVGGIPGNRRAFGQLVAGVDHLGSTHDLEHSAFSRGAPRWGAHLADELERRIIPLHDASNIAAVIVEPFAGSAGVLLPPQGYLERLREICDRHGILLVFDEVISGFGRLGHAFAAERFGVMPDMITCAKGLTNGAVPMGAVIVREGIYDAVVDAAPEGAIELLHGYTYSGHPLAAAAAVAAIDVFEREGLYARAHELAPYFDDAAHALRGRPHVIDIRGMGLVAGIELAPRPGAPPAARGYETFVKCFERGVLVRFTGDIIAVSPPLVIERAEIDRLFGTLGEVLATVA
ncbi:MAG: aspartate aminotransferase family protein [Burkholderiales bacterium]|nr:aspartate aminotransferase family protein [Burkholderiales bacterium]